ncbi:dynein regulatory complex protein 12 isoform X3 [Paramisgurnus dabryanus]|uniref:dynein regulatory complex protein 12 isoform X3 n=1 Tax=Paramisgurnus dabryanus TaxID=90735 RepID=UPI0031F3A8EC
MNLFLLFQGCSSKFFTMPPKKKGKANSKKEKSKKSTPEKDDGLTEKYKRSVLDVAVLKEHLALRTNVARQATADRDDLKNQIRDLEQVRTQERSDMKDITAVLERDDPDRYDTHPPQGCKDLPFPITIMCEMMRKLPLDNSLVDYIFNWWLLLQEMLSQAYLLVSRGNESLFRSASNPGVISD